MKTKIWIANLILLLQWGALEQQLPIGRHPVLSRDNQDQMSCHALYLARNFQDNSQSLTWKLRQILKALTARVCPVIVFLVMEWQSLSSMKIQAGTFVAAPSMLEMSRTGHQNEYYTLKCHSDVPVQSLVLWFLISFMSQTHTCQPIRESLSIHICLSWQILDSLSWS